MTQTIAPSHATPRLTGTWLRMALIFAAGLLLIAAFATGRATASGDSTRTVLDRPIAVDQVTQPFDCPPARPPIC